MRLSADKHDTGYNATLIPRAKVFYNGAELAHCITADEEVGMAVCEVVDENHRLVIQHGQRLTRTIFGAVKISLE